MNMDTKTSSTSVSKALQIALWRIRNKISAEQMKPGFDSRDPDHKTDMVPLFPRLQHWFPVLKQAGIPLEDKNHLRHNILMALTGQPIGSQYELSAGVHKVLKEVLNVNSTYITNSLAVELSEAVQGEHGGAPWEIPAARIN